MEKWSFSLLEGLFIPISVERKDSWSLHYSGCKITIYFQDMRFYFAKKY